MEQAVFHLFAFLKNHVSFKTSDESELPYVVTSWGEKGSFVFQIDPAGNKYGQGHVSKDVILAVDTYAPVIVIAKTLHVKDLWYISCFSGMTEYHSVKMDTPVYRPRGGWTMSTVKPFLYEGIARASRGKWLEVMVFINELLPSKDDVRCMAPECPLMKVYRHMKKYGLKDDDREVLMQSIRDTVVEFDNIKQITPSFILHLERDLADMLARRSDLQMEVDNLSETIRQLDTEIDNIRARIADVSSK